MRQNQVFFWAYIACSDLRFRKSITRGSQYGYSLPFDIYKELLDKGKKNLKQIEVELDGMDKVNQWKPFLFLPQFLFILKVSAITQPQQFG